jgi:hypothetical protein
MAGTKALHGWTAGEAFHMSVWRREDVGQLIEDRSYPSAVGSGDRHCALRNPIGFHDCCGCEVKVNTNDDFLNVIPL